MAPLTAGSGLGYIGGGRGLGLGGGRGCRIGFGSGSLGGGSPVSSSTGGGFGVGLTATISGSAGVLFLPCWDMMTHSAPTPVTQTMKKTAKRMAKTW